MIFFNTSLGIDFRRSHLVFTLLRKSFGKIRLVDYKVYPLLSEGHKGMQEGQWTSFISSFMAQHRISRDRIAVAIPREKVVVRFIRFPIAAKENLRKVLEYESSKYTPFDPEEIYFDYQTLKEDKEGLELIAVFAEKQTVDSYLSALKKMGIQPYTVQIPSAGALNLFFYNEGDQENLTSALIDVNEPFFEMNIIQGKEWKESFHLPLPAENRGGAILEAFQRSDWGTAGSQATFWIFGLDATGRGLPTFEEADSLPEIVLPPLDRLGPTPDETIPDYLYSSIGVPLSGLMKNPIELNLLPPEMRRKFRQINKKFFLTLVILAIVLLGTWAYGTYSYYHKELVVLRSEVKKKKPEVEVLEKLQKQRQEWGKEIGQFEKFSKGEVGKIEVLRELTRILPDSVWIWNLRCSGQEVEISGFADSASDLIPLLDKSSLFEKVEFLAPVTKERERRIGEDRERERFKIKMMLEGQRSESP